MSPLLSASHAVPDAGQRLVAGLAALVLGAFFVWGAGFAQAEMLHDTAHDMRHAFGFPCH